MSVVVLDPDVQDFPNKKYEERFCMKITVVDHLHNTSFLLLILSFNEIKSFKPEKCNR